MKSIKCLRKIFLKFSALIKPSLENHSNFVMHGQLMKIIKINLYSSKKKPKPFFAHFYSDMLILYSSHRSVCMKVVKGEREGKSIIKTMLLSRMSI